MDGSGRVSLRNRVYLRAVVPYKLETRRVVEVKIKVPEVAVCDLGWGGRLPGPEDAPSPEEAGDLQQREDPGMILDV
jgi:hypothetical protein